MSLDTHEEPYVGSDDEGNFDGGDGGGGGAGGAKLSGSLPSNLCSLVSSRAYCQYGRVADDDDEEEDGTSSRCRASGDAAKTGRRAIAFLVVLFVSVLVAAHITDDDGGGKRGSQQFGPGQAVAPEERPTEVQATGTDECSCECDAASSQSESDPASEEVSPGHEQQQGDGDAAPVAPYDGPYRAFEPWEGDFPCYEPPHLKSHRWQTNEYKNITDGLYYVKVPKTGSSTLAGIALRIAHRKGRETFHGPHKMCNVEEGHGSAYRKWRYDRLDKSKSFLYSFIREPTARSLSFFFYKEVSRQKTEPTDSNFLNWTRHDSNGNFQIDYLKLVDHYDSNEDAVDNILSNYNFVGITERLEESLVVLQMLLGLETTDVLFSSSKSAGGFAYIHNNKNPRCVYATPKFVSPRMEEHFQSKEWLHHIKGDTLLYAAVNRSLDATIDKLGRDAFEAKLQEFREAQLLALERCADTAIYPCSAGGELTKDTNCYEADKGCGYPCLDEVADELDKARKGGSKL